MTDKFLTMDYSKAQWFHVTSSKRSHVTEQLALIFVDSGQLSNVRAYISFLLSLFHFCSPPHFCFLGTATPRKASVYNL